MTNNGINQPKWSALTSMAGIDNFIEHRGAIVDEYILTHLDAVTMVAVKGLSLIHI